MKLSDVLQQKRNQVFLYIEDLCEEIETENWRKLHPLGPVHVKIKCRLCGEILADDLKEFGWFENPTFVATKLKPHLDLHK